MSFVCLGITHCYECWTPLRDTETYHCRNCQIKYEEEKNEQQLEMKIREIINNEFIKIKKK